MISQLAWRLFRAELRRGELSIITMAIVLAVSSVWVFTSVTDRIQHAIFDKSTQFIAADRVVRSAYPVELPLAAQAAELGLSYAEQLVFPSMVYANDNLQLANVKAVSDSYPLKGELRVRDHAQAQIITARAPRSGEVWLAERLYYQLGVQTGAEIEIGERLFKVAGQIASEPDAPFSSFMTAPRVMMNMADVASTGVVQPGSRLSYRYMFAGADAALASFEAWVKPQLKDNQRLVDVASGDTPLANSLSKAQQFLLLAGLVGVILAATATAVASRLYCQRHFDTVAMFKLLGASIAQVRTIYLSHFALVTLSSIALGLLLGWAVQSPIAWYVEQSLNLDLPSPGAKPYLYAALSGLLCGVCFTLPALNQLFSVPPMRVIRRTLGDRLLHPASVVAGLVLGVLGLLALFSQSLTLSAILFVTGLLSVVLISLMAQGLLKLVRVSSSNIARTDLKLAVSSLYQRARDNRVQLVGFTIAIKLALVIWVLQSDLIQQWQQQLPEGTPNHFMFNVNLEQKQQIQSRFDQEAIENTPFYAMVRGRLVSVNGEKVSQAREGEGEEKATESRRPGAGRELNLSSAAELPYRNEVLQGRWFNPDSRGETSIEVDFAERLGIELGDQLSFMIGAQQVDVTVSSVRSLDWNTMQPNFYFLMSPDVLSGYNSNHLTSFYLAGEQKPWLAQLLSDIRSIVVLDVGALIEQLQRVVVEVAFALKLVLAVVLLASALVLFAQVQGSVEERKKQLVILRTIGASRSLLRNAIVFEYLVLGLLSGLIAAFAAQVLLSLLQVFVFDVPVSISWWLWLLGPGSGAAVVAAIGASLTLAMMRSNSAKLVREIS